MRNLRRDAATRAQTLRQTRDRIFVSRRSEGISYIIIRRKFGRIIIIRTLSKCRHFSAGSGVGRWQTKNNGTLKTKRKSRIFFSITYVRLPCRNLAKKIIEYKPCPHVSTEWRHPTPKDFFRWIAITEVKFDRLGSLCRNLAKKIN